MTPAHEARIEVMRIALQMGKVSMWLCDNYEEIGPRAANWIAATMINIVVQANITIGILNAPNVNATPAGKRCIFY